VAADHGPNVLRYVPSRTMCIPFISAMNVRNGRVEAQRDATSRCTPTCDLSPAQQGRRHAPSATVMHAWTRRDARHAPGARRRRGVSGRATASRRRRQLRAAHAADLGRRASALRHDQRVERDNGEVVGPAVAGPLNRRRRLAAVDGLRRQPLQQPQRGHPACPRGQAQLLKA
jgi:hypothetical protein